DWQTLSNEEAVHAALRANPPAPGQYVIPFVLDPKMRDDPVMKEKIARGPNGYLTVIPSGTPDMGPMMAKSLVFNLVVSVFVSYVAWHALGTGAQYLDVFRIVGTTSMMSYILATVPESIWFGRPWRAFWLQALDGVVYGLFTAGLFGWLWPR
ncbi:MAG: hypothetical protein ACRD2A_22270, partial [Vicinamibacterales bacterium]